MKRLVSLLLLSFVAAIGYGQTTAVTATITDSDTTVWINASYTVQFVPNQNFPNISQYSINGVALNSSTYNHYLQQSGTTNGSGALAVTLLDNSQILPGGSTWRFTVKSNTSAPAVVYIPTAVTGSTFSLTSYLSTNSIAPRLAALPGSYAYTDGEISVIPNPGGTYFNTISDLLRFWNGTAWVAIAGGGGGLTALTQDVLASGTGSQPATVVGINNTLLSGLATGPLCNTTGTGVPTICPTASTPIPVENFGAVGYSTQAAAVTGTDSTTAIQNCLNSLTAGQCLLQAKFYKITSALSISRSSIGVTGTQQGLINTSVFTTPPISTLVSTSATADFIDVAGSSTTATIAFNNFSHFTLSRSTAPTGTTDTGLSFNFTYGATVDSVVVQDSHRGFYFQASGSIGIGYVQNSAATWGFNGITETSGNFYGFYLDSTTGNPNPSLRIRNSFVVSNIGATPITYGLYSNGNAINDLEVDNLESTGLSYGKYLNYTGGGSSFSAGDIHFWRNIDDTYLISAYSINGLPAAQGGKVTITGCWTFSSTSSSAAVALTNSTGVIVSSCQISGTASTLVNLVNSSNNLFTDNTFALAATAITADADSSNNTFFPNNWAASITTDVNAAAPNPFLMQGFTDNPFFTIANTNPANFSYFEYLGLNKAFLEGVGNGSAGSGLANKWFLFDNTSGANAIAVDSSDNVGVGYSLPLPTTYPGMFNVGTAAQFHVAANGVTTLPTFTVTTLPNASTAGAGATAIVTDGAGTPPTCTGSGSNYQIAVSNGTAWSCH